MAHRGIPFAAKICFDRACPDSVFSNLICKFWLHSYLTLGDSMRRFLVLAALITVVGGFVGCDKKPATSPAGATSGASDPNALVGMTGTGGAGASKAPVVGGASAK